MFERILAKAFRKLWSLVTRSKRADDDLLLTDQAFDDALRDRRELEADNILQSMRWLPPYH